MKNIIEQQKQNAKLIEKAKISKQKCFNDNQKHFVKNAKNQIKFAESEISKMTSFSL